MEISELFDSVAGFVALAALLAAALLLRRSTSRSGAT